MRSLGLILVFGIVRASIDNRQRPDANVLSSVEGIISNDELKCIPRLICERAAGGQPGQLRGLQFDTASLFSLLQYLGLDTGATTPMLEIGRAIMTGISSRGDSYACYQKYPSCPRDQYRLLHYLNNHRGGFFRGFSRPYYGKDNRVQDKKAGDTQSRIVNQAIFSNVIPSNEESTFFQTPSSFQNGQNFYFPVRSGKKVNFDAASPTDHLPSKFSFPVADRDEFTNNLGNGNSFFPLN